MKKSPKKRDFFATAQYFGVLLFVLTIVIIAKGDEFRSLGKLNQASSNSQSSQEVLGIQSTDELISEDTDENADINVDANSVSSIEKFAELQIVDSFPGYAEVVINVDRLVSPTGASICIENPDSLDIQSVECLAPFACFDKATTEGNISLEAIVPMESVDSKSNGQIAVAGIYYNSINGGSLAVNTKNCTSSFYVVGFEESVLNGYEAQFYVNAQ